MSYWLDLGNTGNQHREPATPIDWYAKKGDLKQIRDGIEKGEHATIRSHYWAAEYGHLDVIKYLLEVQPNLLLTYAVVDHSIIGEHYEIAKYLIEECDMSGSKISTKFVASRGHTEMLKYLHKKGHKIGKNLLMDACDNGHLETAKWIHRMCNINVYRISFTKKMFKKQNMEMIKWFYETFLVCRENKEVTPQLHMMIMEMVLAYGSDECVDFMAENLRPDYGFMYIAPRIRKSEKNVKFFERLQKLTLVIPFRNSESYILIDTFNNQKNLSVFEMVKRFTSFNLKKWWNEQFVRYKKIINKNKSLTYSVINFGSPHNHLKLKQLHYLIFGTNIWFECDCMTCGVYRKRQYQIELSRDVKKAKVEPLIKDKEEEEESLDEYQDELY